MRKASVVKSLPRQGASAAVEKIFVMRNALYDESGARFCSRTLAGVRLPIPGSKAED
jgi:hypothetical protein